MIMKKSREMCVISVYANEGMRRVEKKLRDIIEKCMSESKNVIIVGDMNARIGEEKAGGNKDSGDERGRKSQDKKVDENEKILLGVCEDLGLTVRNGRTQGDTEGKITYIGGGDTYMGSVLDLIIEVDRGEGEGVNKLEVITRTESDHLPVIFAVRRKEGERKENKYGEKTKRAGEEKIKWDKDKQTQYATAVKRRISEGQEEGDWETIEEAMWDAAREMKIIKRERTGVERGNGGKKYSEECRRAKKEVLSRLKEWTKERTEDKKKRVRESRRELKTIEKREKREWIKEKWEEIDKAKDGGEWWRALNRFTNKRKRTAGEEIGEEE